jgi:tetratricopeptide (TPR) repeat protein
MAMAAGLVLTLIVTAAAQEPQQPQEQPQRPKVDPLKADQAFPNDPVAILLEASRLKALGRLDDALASYQQVLKLDSKNFEAHLGAGTVYDLKGNYADARRELDQAINAAPDNAREQRDQALTAMAVSYAFEGDIENAKSYYEKLYDFQVSTQRLDKAATTANSIGRAYLDAGDTRQAAQWYQTGQETVKKMSGLSSEDLDMWQMRFEHAQARIAARSGNAEEAETHAATMKTLIDKTVGSGVNGRAAAAVLGQSYQYLVGYDAFYAGKLDDAIAALQKADQHDPAVLGLIAEAYAKKGDLDNARVYADKVTGPPTHTLQSALMRREVKKIDELKPKEKDAKSKSDKPEKIEKTDKTENEAKKQP